jgi:hypothetical protein
MGLFSKKKADAPTENLEPTRPGSDATTPAPSGAPSVLAKDEEKNEPVDVTARNVGAAEVSVEAQRPGEEHAGENAMEKRIEGIEQDEEEAEDAGVVYPKKSQLTLITIALCLSVFCMALDNTIISTAIPKITDQFNSIDDVGWYGSAYLLTTCAFQLFFGKLYTFLSIKWIYLTAILIFEVGSALCGAAPTSAALIVGRAIAGLGSAGIFSGAVLIVTNTVPLKQRPTYMGLIGGMYGIASVAGPLMGGAFTDKVTWRYAHPNLPKLHQCHDKI